jgi:hypothetical protein
MTITRLHKVSDTPENGEFYEEKVKFDNPSEYPESIDSASGDGAAAEGVSSAAESGASDAEGSGSDVASIIEEILGSL